MGSVNEKQKARRKSIPGWMEATQRRRRVKSQFWSFHAEGMPPWLCIKASFDSSIPSSPPRRIPDALKIATAPMAAQRKTEDKTRAIGVHRRDGGEALDDTALSDSGIVPPGEKEESQARQSRIRSVIPSP